MAPKNQRFWLTTDEVSIAIDAPAEQIYDMVADLPRMGEWSPECAAVEWSDGASGPAVGARFVGHNRTGPRGLIKWSRRGRVVAADRGREFAFATEEGGVEGTTWRYRFESVDGRHAGHRELHGGQDPGVGADPRRAHQPPPRADGGHGTHARPAEGRRGSPHRRELSGHSRRLSTAAPRYPLPPARPRPTEQGDPSWSTHPPSSPASTCSPPTSRSPGSATSRSTPTWCTARNRSSSTPGRSRSPTSSSRRSGR